MARFRLFHGLRFAPDAGPLSDLVCPPYDVIDPPLRAQLAARHPHNIVRLELPQPRPDQPSEDRYPAARDLLHAWQRDRILLRDDAPTLYVYSQRYVLDRRPGERFGVLVALRLAPYAERVVLPHEQTFSAHKEDRYQLLRTARAQISPILGLYAAPGAGVRGRLEAATRDRPPLAAPDDEGGEHRLWPLADPELAAWLVGALAPAPVFIADGHHRYETALRHQAERRADASDAPPQWYDFIAIHLIEMDDPGLVLLPTHRLLRGGLPSAETLLARLRAAFDIAPATYGDPAPIAAHELTLILPGERAWRLSLRAPDALRQRHPERSDAWCDLDVALLHHLALPLLLGDAPEPEIAYTRDAEEAWRAVARGEQDAAFLLPPPRMEQLQAVAGAGEVMPRKSTFFWPKATAGLVIYDEHALD